MRLFMLDTWNALCYTPHNLNGFHRQFQFFQTFYRRGQMMANIQLAIEGQNALKATEKLLEIPEISGDWQPASEEDERGLLATIATIVGIVGGTAAIAEQIRKWYQEWKKGKAGKNIDKVVMVGSGGERLLLEGATAEDISKILESLK